MKPEEKQALENMDKLEKDLLELIGDYTFPEVMAVLTKTLGIGHLHYTDLEQRRSMLEYTLSNLVSYSNTNSGLIRVSSQKEVKH